MSAKAVREVQSLAILRRHLDPELSGGVQLLNFASIDSLEDLDSVTDSHPWLLETKLVVKVDQLIKRRAQQGLIAVNVDWKGAQDFVKKHINQEFTIGKTIGKLKTFIVVPFVPHKQDEEYYICIHSLRDYDEILFTTEGGVDIGNVESRAKTLKVNAGDSVTGDQVTQALLETVPDGRKGRVAQFICSLHEVFKSQYFTYLEINPLVVTDSAIFVLDLAAKVDSAADFLVPNDRSNFAYPAPFGRDATPEEAKIAELDGRTGASLKLTILNERGRIWTLVAGGGASVIFADTIVEKSNVEDLANYGEYSGAPNEEQTYQYAKTVIDLMCRYPHPDGKILVIGGGIANFTNVADTLKGIIRAIKESEANLKANNTKIFVRRGGPNYKEGLKLMRNLGATTGLPIEVYGPEINMTAIVGMALGEDTSAPDNDVVLPPKVAGKGDFVVDAPKPIFTDQTQAIIFGRQIGAAQRMLDFDKACGRTIPSVACIVDPFTSTSRQAAFWGTKPHYLPIYATIREAVKHHPEADVVVNFASFRSAFEVTMESMKFPNIRTIAIIAEGIPENQTRQLIIAAQEKNVTVIGPATVGGIKPGCFRIGNTGGAMDNIISSKLYRPGSVAYVSRSGGMSNELNNIIARNTNGVYEGVAIGGDRYPGTTFMDHLLRYQDDPEVKMLVLLGEVGGVEEYKVCEALRSGRINKPMVAWCIGTCGDMFSTDVQFGHAGASASGDAEKAKAKNQALAEAGAIVPRSFQELDQKISAVYKLLVADGMIVPQPEPVEPQTPMDFAAAQKAGLIRRPATFLSSISDDRGEELTYAGVPISQVVSSARGIGNVLGLLWFKKPDLPDYFLQFLELCVMITADHGPAVSGAHNTIVAARAGKDLVSSLVSGLCTIGPRFGGALNDAAEQFTAAFDQKMSPAQFVDDMKKKNQYIMGIGHRVKSVENPDSRVIIIKKFIAENFPQHPLFDFALEVEKVTTAKRANLILNVDGAIAVAFVDLLRQCDKFTKEEADRYIKSGILNAIFVFGRSAGLIGHYIDQVRLDQPLYRCPWEDIAYLN